MKPRDPNDNTLTRLIVMLELLLVAVAVMATFSGITFASGSEHPIGAGLCFLAAAGALGTGLLAVVQLLKS